MSSPGPFECALCGAFVRSVYSLPGESGARMCSICFFNEGEAPAATGASSSPHAPTPIKEKEACDE